MNHEAPHTTATESASGLDPDRVLLLGPALFPASAPPALGARTLASELAAATGRGADVTVVAWAPESGTPLATAARGLRPAAYDVVVLAVPPGAVRDRPASAVVGELAAAITAFRGVTHPAAPFVVSVGCGSQRGHVAAALQASVPGVVAVASDEDTADTRGRVVAVTHAALAEQRARPDSPQRQRDAPQPDEQRVRALADLEVLDTDGERRYDRIVEAMGQLFGTQGAAINFITDDRQWSKSGTWNAIGSQPISDSFCAVTVRGSGPLVVGDAWLDDRPLPHNDIRFYAGYPIETLDGVRVGAVCVFDSVPRDERSVELDLLRDYAILARAELYR